MNGPLSIFEMLGVVIVVMSTFLTLGVMLVLASIGAHFLYRCCLTGAELYESDMRRGADVREPDRIVRK